MSLFLSLMLAAFAGEGLSKRTIHAVVEKHRAEVRACYDAALRVSPATKGKVAVGFTVAPDGAVSAASVKTNTTASEALGDCLVGRLKSWTFPKTESGEATEVGSYPFDFNPKS
jgi:hypothetical protein